MKGLPVALIVSVRDNTVGVDTKAQNAQTIATQDKTQARQKAGLCHHPASLKIDVLNVTTPSSTVLRIVGSRPRRR